MLREQFANRGYIESKRHNVPLFVLSQPPAHVKVAYVIETGVRRRSF